MGWIAAGRAARWSDACVLLPLPVYRHFRNPTRLAGASRAGGTPAVQCRSRPCPQLRTTSCATAVLERLLHCIAGILLAPASDQRFHPASPSSASPSILLYVLDLQRVEPRAKLRLQNAL